MLKSQAGRCWEFPQRRFDHLTGYTVQQPGTPPRYPWRKVASRLISSDVREYLRDFRQKNG